MKRFFYKLIFSVTILFMLAVAGIYVGGLILFFGAGPETRSALVRLCASFLVKMKERKFLKDVDDDMLILEKERIKKRLAATINKL